MQSRLKYNQQTNKAFGDNILNDSEFETILFQNINGIKDETNWTQIIHTMKDLNIDIFGFAEINKSMDNFSKQKWTGIIQKQFYLSRTIHSESSVKFDSEYKPGGTITTVTGKWQARITEMGQDRWKLGRWSYIRISSKKSNLIIITAYRPCKTSGPMTAWMQQWTILRESGMAAPDPVKSFYQDLEQELQSWAQKEYEILLMLDANEHIGEKPGGISQIIAKFKLTDLVLQRHPEKEIPNTYARGSRRIDYIFGTPKVAQNCAQVGILPYGTGFSSDHRGIFIRVDMEKILSTSVSASESIYARKLQNATPKEREKFIDETHKHYECHNLIDRLQKLHAISEWTQEHLQEYERCDAQHIQGMLSAEKKTRKIRTTPWSPKFGAAVSRKSFWKIALSLKLTHTRPSDEYITWSQALGIQDFKSIDITRIKKELRTAQKHLREITKQAAELREEHLKELIQHAEENSNDASFQKRLQNIKKAHQRQQHYKKIRNILKPSQKTGLSYILVPKDFNADDYPYDPETVQGWEPVHEQSEMQNLIQKRNIAHFGQAHGTPFTVEPLNKLNWEANSMESKEILEGSVPISLLQGDEYTRKVLNYIAKREQLPEIDTHITPAQLSLGFKKWKEETSTSPSGCHLGLRRIPAFQLDNKESEKIRGRIQQVQADIVNIPIARGFSPQRWRTVVNAMLEKISGKPLLHKL
jgi:exonuclease III